MDLAPPLIRLNMVADERGALVAIEGRSDLPFAIERVYYIVAKSGGSRGFHAHKRLEQLLVCPIGSCRVILDDGRARSEHLLEGPDQALYVGAMMWREMHDFSDGSVLLVLASAPYDEADYIRDYDSFRRAVSDRADGG